MKIRYWAALCVICTSSIFSLDLDSMMSQKDKKSTGYGDLTSEQKKHLNQWISEHFVLPPDTIGNSPLSLNINIQNGRELILSDGSHWEVAPDDQKISSLWLTPFPLEITSRDSKQYPYSILNLTTKEMVKARQVTPVKQTPIVK
ncbi:MAG: hypothetical protein K2Q34_08620 [Alphaproteobacteria bacterium]|nr:hypothetical protein [Alphaproteobacteria bacterium]